MRRIFAVLTVLAIVTVPGHNAGAADLDLSFVDPVWSGGSVPQVGLCTMHGGKGMSPAIKVAGLPGGTERLVVRFSDRDWGDEGAHGVVGVAVTTGASSTLVPSFKGETDSLPAGVDKISQHGCRACAGGVYLGPCSGGARHHYFVTIEAQSSEGKTLASGKLTLGDF